HDCQVLILLAGIGVEGLRIKGRKCAYQAGKLSHGVRLRWKTVEEFLHIFMDQRVPTDFTSEVLQRIGRGQIAIYQQIGYFQKRRLLCQLFNWISTVMQYT